MTLRIVLLTEGGPFGREVARGLRARGVPLHAVVAVGSGRFAAGPGPAPLRLARAAGRALLRARHRLRLHRRFRGLGERIVPAGPLNGPAMLRALAALRPDYVLLGGVGIVSPELLRTAREGVLNSHPGLLPWARGTGVVAHALARGVAVGATCHFVNPGIDLGDVVERRLLPVERGCPLDELEARADALAAALLADVAAGIVRGGPPARTPQAERFPLCRWMDAEERARVDARARAGLAAELFRAWSPLCDDPATFRLPPDAAPPTPPAAP